MPAPAHDAPLPVDDDAALARAAAAGDVAAFEQLYRRHAGRVLGVITRLVGQAGGRAEELAQDAFVRAWQALPRFRFESAFATWLHRLAVNTALMDLRARRELLTRQSGEEALAELGVGDTAGGHTALGMDLAQAVASLPTRARAVLVLHDVEGWSHEDIAASLEIAIGTSKAQLHRARGLLRQRLGDPS